MGVYIVLSVWPVGLLRIPFQAVGGKAKGGFIYFCCNVARSFMWEPEVGD